MISASRAHVCAGKMHPNVLIRAAVSHALVAGQVRVGATVDRWWWWRRRWWRPEFAGTIIVHSLWVEVDCSDVRASNRRIALVAQDTLRRGNKQRLDWKMATSCLQPLKRRHRSGGHLGSEDSRAPIDEVKKHQRCSHSTGQRMVCKVSTTICIRVG